MEPATFLRLISDLPFSMVMAFYLLVRIEPLLANIARTQAAQLEILRMLMDDDYQPPERPLFERPNRKRA
jgi:hypothetical protein